MDQDRSPRAAGPGASVMRVVLMIAAILSLSLRGVAQTAPASGRAASVILTDHCVSCHGPEKKKGGLDLTRRSSALAGGDSGAVIVPGRPGESLLIEKVAGGEMPPKGPLSKDQVAAVRAWVEAGAPYPSEPLAPRRAGADWWSLRPIR